MSNPAGVTMPALDLLESSVAVLRKSSTVLGQVVRVQPQSQIPTRKVARLGDTNKYTSYQPAEHSLQLEIYGQKTVKEMALLLGGTAMPGSGGWVGTEVLRLNPTVAKFDLLLDVYDAATGTGDDLQGTWTFKNFKPTTLNPNYQSDSSLTFTINGECDDIYYEPEAGIGA